MNATEDITLWRRLSKRNHEDAQQLLVASSFRLAISRSWYSAMASVHAVLIALGHRAPARGNWSNPELPALILDAVKTKFGAHSDWAAAARMHRNDLAELWTRRLLADYRPSALIDESDARFAVKCAGKLVRRLESMS